MSIREFLPKDWKSLVRLVIALAIIKVAINAVYSRLPATVQNYMPNLG